MLNPRLVPSRLIAAADRQPVEIRPATRPSRLRVLEVGRNVLKWLLLLFRLFLTGKLTHQAFARTVKELFEHMGGLWIKVGQLLSLRNDMFSAELCQELSGLQGRAVGFPSGDAVRIVEQQLGGPISRFFDEFDLRPFAAASIGQIHRARIKETGAWVAVKIQRPFLDEIFFRDLAVVNLAFRLLMLFRIYPFMHWDEGLRELREIMREELDCRYEASAYRRMRKSLKKHGVYVPTVFNKLTTSKVLVTEFVHAVLMADCIAMADKDPARVAAWFQENNIDPHVLAVNLLQSSFRQLFEENLYHGDMHPGNILVLRDSRIALIDFGAVSFTELEYWQKSRLFIKALVTGDYAKAADTAFLLCGSLPRIDLEKVKGELIEVLRAWGARALVQALPYREKSMDNAFLEVGKVLFRHRFAMQWTGMRLRRGSATLDASVIYLYPDMDTSREFRRFLRRAERRTLRRNSGLQLLPRLIKGIATAIEVAENTYEQALYQGSLIRRQAQVFEGTTGSFAYLFSVFYRQFSLLQLAVGALFTAGFFYQHRPAWINPWIGPQFTRILKVFPYLDTQIWIMIIVVNGYLLLTSVRIGSRFARRESGPTQIG